MVICTSCDDIECRSWYEFFEHCYIAHPTERQHVRQVPFNISGRTKMQIIVNAEDTYLQEYLIV